MVTATVELDGGLTIKDTVHKKAVIREANGGDLIDATEESEKLVIVGDGPALVASPTMVGLNTLRRQIVSIGDYPGPLTVAELRKLSATDLSLLQEKASELEQAVWKGAADRGRGDAGEKDDH